MEIRIRFGSRVAAFASAPVSWVQVEDGATIGQLLARLAETQPALSAVLPSTLAVIDGEHASSGRTLRQGDEVALLMPMAGGSSATEMSDF